MLTDAGELIHHRRNENKHSPFWSLSLSFEKIFDSLQNCKIKWKTWIERFEARQFLKICALLLQYSQSFLQSQFP